VQRPRCRIVSTAAIPAADDPGGQHAGHLHVRDWAGGNWCGELIRGERGARCHGATTFGSCVTGGLPRRPACQTEERVQLARGPPVRTKHVVPGRIIGSRINGGGNFDG
jgi:hypothetical protein